MTSHWTHTNETKRRDRAASRREKRDSIVGVRIILFSGHRRQEYEANDIMAK